MGLPVVDLKAGREKAVRHFHPWIFTGAIEKESTSCTPSEAVLLRDHQKNPLALGLYNPHSQIRVRWLISSLGRTEKVSLKEIIQENIRRALERRFKQFSEAETNAYRLIFSEGDDLPGLILDRFGSLVILQLETESMDSLRDFLVPLIWEEVIRIWPGCDTLWERSTGDGRKPEGLPPVERVHFGSSGKKQSFRENGLNFDYPALDQKSGYYLDQRENRSILGKFCEGKEVLDCCSYTGAFSRYALEGGAQSVDLVDVSRDALDRAESQLKGAGFSSFQLHCRRAADFFRENSRSWELIILDPPKLVPSKKHLTKGLRAYKDLNLQAIKHLAPGGILASFSCSGLVSSEELIRQIGWAAQDAGRPLQIIGELHQASCHPWGTHFPEGRYLKGFLLRG